MKLDKDDQAIIEQALKAAAMNSADYQEIYRYESVLQKLGTTSGAAQPGGDHQQDGFRYDYDDASDVQ
ncbi:hypothetical protein [Ectobacillus ponti]|uniref:Uncharacterized protein n=1 Tax=Ectobacillus ponti TaxID=2961894 RepID=A0AA42BQM8_9BACI|nr:hypothetical protein [Ectobacillus ponti]MCP8968619.1 hypothetical protein [Ectobacillus ponti]